MKTVAAAVLLGSGLGAKLQDAQPEHQSSAGLHLRGLQPLITGTAAVSDIYPVAPLDELSRGVEVASNTMASSSVSYTRKGELPPDAFPHRYDPKADRSASVLAVKPPTDLRGQRVECHDSMLEWADANGNSCYEYAKGTWCTREGKAGSGWLKEWGVFSEWSQAMHPNGPTDACCVCGGGLMMVASTETSVPLAERRLVAPEDTIGKVTLIAPEDAVTPEFMESRRVVAPMDNIPTQFSHFFGELRRQGRKSDLLGLTARFYDALPTNDCKGAAPVASAIDRVLDFGGSGGSGGDKGSFMEFIESQNREPGRVYYGKWTGTLNILMAGRYTLDLDIGFDTMSSLKIDGEEIKTVGQCRVAQDELSCFKKGCAWKSKTCVPEAAEAALLAVEQYPGVEAGLVAAAPAAAPTAPAAISAASPFAAEEDLMPHAEPEAKKSEEAKEAKKVEEAEKTKSSAYAGKNTPLQLSAGGHCIEIVVMATTAHGSMRLRYNGPDTDGLDTVTPGQVLFCDPVVPACRKPELDACAAFKSDCSDPDKSKSKEAASSKSLEALIPSGWKVPEMMKEVRGPSSTK